MFDQALAEKEAAAAVAKGLRAVRPRRERRRRGFGAPEPAPPLWRVPHAVTPHLESAQVLRVQRVSFEEMIACENEACAVAWFHRLDAGLSTDALPRSRASRTATRARRSDAWFSSWCESGEKAK